MTAGEFRRELQGLLTLVRGRVNFTSTSMLGSFIAVSAGIPAVSTECQFTVRFFEVKWSGTTR